MRGYITTLKPNGDSGGSYPMTQIKSVIGRGEDCSIRILIPSIANKHCEIRAPINKQASLRHLSDTSDTLINGISISPTSKHLLNHLDIITVEGRHLRWEYPTSSKFYCENNGDVGSRTMAGMVEVPRSIINERRRSTELKEKIEVYSASKANKKKGIRAKVIYKPLISSLLASRTKKSPSLKKATPNKYRITPAKTNNLKSKKSTKTLVGNKNGITPMNSATPKLRKSIKTPGSKLQIPKEKRTSSMKTATYSVKSTTSPVAKSKLLKMTPMKAVTPKVRKSIKITISKIETPNKNRITPVKTNSVKSKKSTKTPVFNKNRMTPMKITSSKLRKSTKTPNKNRTSPMKTPIHSTKPIKTPIDTLKFPDKKSMPPMKATDHSAEIIKTHSRNKLTFMSTPKLLLAKEHDTLNVPNKNSMPPMKTTDHSAEIIKTHSRNKLTFISSPKLILTKEHNHIELQPESLMKSRLSVLSPNRVDLKTRDNLESSKKIKNLEDAEAEAVNAAKQLKLESPDIYDKNKTAALLVCHGRKGDSLSKIIPTKSSSKLITPELNKRQSRTSYSQRQSQITTVKRKSETTTSMLDDKERTDSSSYDIKITPENRNSTDSNSLMKYDSPNQFSMNSIPTIPTQKPDQPENIEINEKDNELSFADYSLKLSESSVNSGIYSVKSGERHSISPSNKTDAEKRSSYPVMQRSIPSSKKSPAKKLDDLLLRSSSFTASTPRGKIMMSDKILCEFVKSSDENEHNPSVLYPGGYFSPIALVPGTSKSTSRSDDVLESSKKDFSPGSERNINEENHELSFADFSLKLSESSVSNSICSVKSGERHSISPCNKMEAEKRSSYPVMQRSIPSSKKSPAKKLDDLLLRSSSFTASTSRGKIMMSDKILCEFVKSSDENEHNTSVLCPGGYFSPIALVPGTSKSTSRSDNIQESSKKDFSPGFESNSKSSLTLNEATQKRIRKPTSKSPEVSYTGAKDLFKQNHTAADYTNIIGVKRMFGSPLNKTSYLDVTGVRRMFNEVNSSKSSDLSGIETLFDSSPPVQCKEQPSNSEEKKSPSNQCSVNFSSGFVMAAAETQHVPKTRGGRKRKVSLITSGEKQGAPTKIKKMKERSGSSMSIDEEIKAPITRQRKIKSGSSMSIVEEIETPKTRQRKKKSGSSMSIDEEIKAPMTRKRKMNSGSLMSIDEEIKAPITRQKQIKSGSSMSIDEEFKAPITRKIKMNSGSLMSIDEEIKAPITRQKKIKSGFSMSIDEEIKAPITRQRKINSGSSMSIDEEIKAPITRQRKINSGSSMSIDEEIKAPITRQRKINSGSSMSIDEEIKAPITRQRKINSGSSMSIDEEIKAPITRQRKINSGSSMSIDEEIKAPITRQRKINSGSSMSIDEEIKAPITRQRKINSGSSMSIDEEIKAPITRQRKINSGSSMSIDEEIKAPITRQRKINSGSSMSIDEEIKAPITRQRKINSGSSMSIVEEIEAPKTRQRKKKSSPMRKEKPKRTTRATRVKIA